MIVCLIGESTILKPELNIQRGDSLIFSCGPSIIWTRDRDRTFLVDSHTPSSWMLQGTEAMVWDLLVLAYAYPKMVTLLSVVLGVPTGEVRGLLLDILVKWHKQGILEITGSVRDGEPDDQHPV